MNNEKWPLFCNQSKRFSNRKFVTISCSLIPSFGISQIEKSSLSKMQQIYGIKRLTIIKKFQVCSLLNRSLIQSFTALKHFFCYCLVLFISFFTHELHDMNLKNVHTYTSVIVLYICCKKCCCFIPHHPLLCCFVRGRILL